MKEILFEQGAIRLIKYDSLTPSFKSQIAKTILGREGKLRYQHTYAIQNAEKLTDTIFLELQWRDRLIGAVALSLQNVEIDSKDQTVIYVRYFSISGLLSNRQGQSGEQKRQKNSIIKSAITSIFDQPEKLFPGVSIAGFYAYVEDQNLPSRKNVEMTGFEKVSQFTTNIYSRIHPKLKLELKQVSRNNGEEIYKNLSNYYQKYDLVPKWRQLISNPKRKYLYHQAKGEIIAGACISHNQWNIQEIPGLTGWLNKHILSKIPGLRNIFFGATLDFIDMEMVYIKEGYEHFFPDLVESIMHREQSHHMLFWTDPYSHLHQQISKGRKFGLLQRLNAPTLAGVYFKNIGLTRLPSTPCYISADGIS